MFKGKAVKLGVFGTEEISKEEVDISYMIYQVYVYVPAKFTSIVVIRFPWTFPQTTVRTLNEHLLPFKFSMVSLQVTEEEVVIVGHLPQLDAVMLYVWDGQPLLINWFQLKASVTRSWTEMISRSILSGGKGSRKYKNP